ncbi:tyrosine-type recombinase/integrase [Kozakia baliensis]|uniref:tyrosine-type recombinase/integrase n=1 Tax=Kozakia baliensis TaxID=153496 RepID=UPI00068AF67E|nr:integrase arm-type DNA-binding domain-containing protein [Kozakia baliensis]
MLTDSQVRTAKGKEKAYKITDGGGLYVQITPPGGKHWRWRYEFNKKEKTLTLGSYPEVSLADARVERDAARKVLRAGRDPSIEKRIIRAAIRTNPGETFEATARAWHEQRIDLWTERHARDVLRSLERDIFPSIGHMPIVDITPPIVLETLRAIERRGAIETAHRVRQRMSDVFVHAIACGHGSTDPAQIVAPALRPMIRGRQPAIVDLPEALMMIRKVEAENAHPTTLLALRLLYLTAVRPSEVRFAQWNEFSDLEGDAPVWVIPAERMKMKREHIVPLSRQAVDVVKATRAFSGRWPHLFASARRPRDSISENALGYLLNRAGYHHRHVPHGFRALFSSVMNEHYPADRHVIDAMLAHTNKNRTEAAYNRAQHLERRRALGQIWADMISEDQVDVGTLVSQKRRASPIHVTMERQAAGG